MGHPTIERLRERLAYCPDTGTLTWRHSGRRAGCLRKDGYRVVRVDDVLMYEHRVAWAIQMGRWCEEIDHIDHNPSNNSWINLRECNSAENKWNSSKKAYNTSGYKGVCRCSRTSKWRALIRCAGKRFELGPFDTPEQAAIARARKASELHGEFSYDDA